jgi:hypothetical protein
MTKWYADCVDPAGRAAIAYWASVTIGPANFVWHSVAVYEPGAPPHECTSFADVPPPTVTGDGIRWPAPALGCELVASGSGPAPELELHDSDRGTIAWQCMAPSARTVICVDGHAPVAGGGYVERLVMTVPPWRLPFEELRWGRWIGHDGTRSCAWIDWRGEEPRTWMLVNGVPRAGARVFDALVRVDDASLALPRPRTLHARSLDDVARLLGPFAALVPDSLRVLRETKWCSPGDWCDAGGTPGGGWAIHERTVFR